MKISDTYIQNILIFAFGLKLWTKSKLLLIKSSIDINVFGDILLLCASLFIVAILYKLIHKLVATSL